MNPLADCFDPDELIVRGFELSHRFLETPSPEDQ
jgi:hypothetical protein